MSRDLRRLVVTGSECTGKTTLAAALAARLNTAWAPEHAREYAQGLRRELTAADVEPIAHGQLAAEDRAAAQALARDAEYVVLDTDLISTIVYARHYYGACPAWIEDAARTRRGDLYFLCRPDLPWSADGVRDRPTRREEIDELFVRALGEFGAAVVDVRGAGAARLTAAIAGLPRDKR